MCYTEKWLCNDMWKCKTFSSYHLQLFFYITSQTGQKNNCVGFLFLLIKVLHISSLFFQIYQPNELPEVCQMLINVSICEILVKGLLCSSLIYLTHYTCITALVWAEFYFVNRYFEFEFTPPTILWNWEFRQRSVQTKSSDDYKSQVKTDDQYRVKLRYLFHFFSPKIWLWCISIQPLP